MMTTQQKLVQKKQTLLELGEYLQNVSEPAYADIYINGELWSDVKTPCTIKLPVG